MSIVIKSDNFKDFIEQVIKAAQDGYSETTSVSSVGYGLGLKTRMASFDILTFECGKIYRSRGLSGMVAIVAELASQGRKIRSVTPVSIYKDSLLISGYTTLMRSKPEYKEAVSDDTLEEDYTESLGGVTEEESKPEVIENYRALSQKKLLSLCKEKGLKGNIKTSKGKLIETLKEHEQYLADKNN